MLYLATYSNYFDFYFVKLLCFCDIDFCECVPAHEHMPFKVWVLIVDN